MSLKWKYLLIKSGKNGSKIFCPLFWFLFGSGLSVANFCNCFHFWIYGSNSPSQIFATCAAIWSFLVQFYLFLFCCCYYATLFLQLHLHDVKRHLWVVEIPLTFLYAHKFVFWIYLIPWLFTKNMKDLSFNFFWFPKGIQPYAWINLVDKASPSSLFNF